MARQYGVAGEWARVRGTVSSLWPLFLSFVLLGAFLSALVLGGHTWLFGALFVASLIAVIVYWRKGMRRVESFFRGARGEELVAKVLVGLPDAYHVDHVEAGPTGVFSIETKNWRGRVEIVEGHILANGALPSRNPAQQAQREADRVKARLAKLGFDVTIVPVVCFASDSFVGDTRELGSAKIVNANALDRWILAQPETLAASDLARLVQLMNG